MVLVVVDVRGRRIWRFAFADATFLLHSLGGKIFSSNCELTETLASISPSTTICFLPGLTARLMGFRYLDIHSIRVAAVGRCVALRQNIISNDHQLTGSIRLCGNLTSLHLPPVGAHLIPRVIRGPMVSPFCRVLCHRWSERAHKTCRDFHSRERIERWYFMRYHRDVHALILVIIISDGRYSCTYFIFM